MQTATYGPILCDNLERAFTSATLGEWLFYADMRSAGGFNAVLIAAVPFGPPSGPNKNETPFFLNPSGGYMYDQPNMAYYEKARKMLRAARERGITPVLSLLDDTFMPKSAQGAHIDRVMDQFAAFNPIYLCGVEDENGAILTKSTLAATALKKVKLRQSGAAVVLHTSGAPAVLHEIIDAGAFDAVAFPLTAGKCGEICHYGLQAPGDTYPAHTPCGSVIASHYEGNLCGVITLAPRVSQWQRRLYPNELMADLRAVSGSCAPFTRNLLLKHGLTAPLSKNAHGKGSYALTSPDGKTVGVYMPASRDINTAGMPCAAITAYELGTRQKSSLNINPNHIGAVLMSPFPGKETLIIFE